jgi:glycosyltransferase involved in cell wall biosynthesis
VEIVYTSKELRRRHRGNGCVLESPVDVARFRPWRIVSPARPFTIGRLSRDIRSKHHEDDPVLWRELAEAGCRIRIMGGTCLADELREVPNVELLPAGAEDAASFLRSLDCFVYRTSEQWFEAYGRVVIEAMATGLPIVVARRGGYADGLRDGANGLLFDSTNDAVARVLELRDDRRVASRIGHAARQSAVELNLVDLPRRTVAFLMNGGVMAADTAGLRTATT